MAYALQGIRVIDLAGPGINIYLGDQGAEVVKTEPRLVDDNSRFRSTALSRAVQPRFDGTEPEQSSTASTSSTKNRS